MPPKSRYQALHDFTVSLHEAFLRTGIHSRILEADREDPKSFLDKIFSDLPDCTLSFNGLLPDEEGRFFCDLIKVPHVACLVDAPHRFLALTHSPYSIITSVDRYTCDFFQGLNFDHVLFMPHAADRKVFNKNSHPEKKRTIDILMLASFIDFEEIQKSWRKTYSTGVNKALDEACELAISDPKISYVHALAEMLDKHSKIAGFDPRQFDFITLLDQVEDFINGKDRVTLLQSIQDQKIELYGAGSHHFKKYLNQTSHVNIHEPVSYEHAISLMQNSKIVLNSCPSIKYGAHERIFSGILAGALVLTNDNIFMRENFKDKENILFYQHCHMEELGSLVKEYLKEDQKRIDMVKKGQDIVLNHHTWDHRAATLISELEPILKNIKPF